VFHVKRLTFRSDFDGGNLAGARSALDSDGVTEIYELSVSPDCSGTFRCWRSGLSRGDSLRCAGTRAETEYRMWYHFRIEGGRPGMRIRVAIADLNPMVKVYSSDLRPVVRVPELSPSWER
jgi:hypothetical protein